MDLFNNPMVDEARKNMTPEMLQRYTTYGEQLHSINFENVMTDKMIQISNCMFWLDKALKAGLLVEDLTKDEINFLEQELGKDWQKAYM